MKTIGSALIEYAPYAIVALAVLAVILFFKTKRIKG